MPKINIIKRNTSSTQVPKRLIKYNTRENPVIVIMGNSLERIMSAAGGRDDGTWSLYVTNSQRKKCNSHKRLQCQLCKKYQQQCLTCGAYGDTDVGGSSMLHVSSTPNLGGGYIIKVVDLFSTFRKSHLFTF